jgi:hypothetical protein
MSIPSIPIAGVFVDPALSLALKVKIVNNQNEPTAVGTAVGLLQSRVAIQVSNAFSLDPPMTVLDMEDEPTTFPTCKYLFITSSLVIYFSLNIFYYQPQQPICSAMLGQMV